MYIGSVCVCTLCSVWGVVAGAPNQALSWQRAALTLPCWLVENIKNMVAGGELVADIKPTFMCHCRQCLRVASFPQSSQGAWDWAVLGDADSRGSYQGDHCWPIKPTWIKKLLEWRQSEWSEMIESYAEAIKGLCKKIGEIRRINLEAVWGVGLAAMQVHLLYTPHYLHRRPMSPPLPVPVSLIFGRIFCHKSLMLDRPRIPQGGIHDRVTLPPRKKDKRR